MGMFDTIIDEQVKCFNHPIYSNGDLWFSGGKCKYYGIGSEVPYKTFWYDYTQNFNIMDTSDGYGWDDIEDSEKDILHIIRDGKVVGTVSFDNISEEYFGDNIKVIGRFGDSFNIHSYDDYKTYLCNKKKYRDLYHESHKKSDKLLRMIWDYKRAGDKEEMHEAMLQYEQEKAKENVLLEPMYEELVARYERDKDSLAYEESFKFGAYLDCLIRKTERLYDLVEMTKEDDENKYFIEYEVKNLPETMQLIFIVESYLSDKFSDVMLFLRGNNLTLEDINKVVSSAKDAHSKAVNWVNNQN